MYTDEIKNILLEKLYLDEVYVSMNKNHCQIIIISKIFIGKSRLEQHQIVYAPIMNFIINNKIHSISIHSFNPKEWLIQCQLYNI